MYWLCDTPGVSRMPVAGVPVGDLIVSPFCWVYCTACSQHTNKCAAVLSIKFQSGPSKHTYACSLVSSPTRCAPCPIHPARGACAGDSTGSYICMPSKAACVEHGMQVHHATNCRKACRKGTIMACDVAYMPLQRIEHSDRRPADTPTDGPTTCQDSVGCHKATCCPRSYCCRSSGSLSTS